MKDKRIPVSVEVADEMWRRQTRRARYGFGFIAAMLLVMVAAAARFAWVSYVAAALAMAVGGYVVGMFFYVDRVTSLPPDESHDD